MKRIVFILLLLPPLAFGQAFTFQDQTLFNVRAAITDTNNHGLVTNITGYPVFAWYPITGNCATNSGVFTATNLASWTDANSNLTNQSAGSFPIYTTGSLNGYAALSFDGTDDKMQALGIASYAAGFPHEVFLVMAYTNTTTPVYFFSGAGSSPSLRINTGLLNIRNGVTSGNDLTPSNKWMVVNGIFATNVNSLVMLTNGVVAARANDTAGTTTDRIEIGKVGGASSYANFVLAEAIFYRTNLEAMSSAPGTVMPTGVRSNVFYYLTNKYAISLNSGP